MTSSTAKRMKRPLGDQKSELTFITELDLVLAPDAASYQMVVAGTLELTVQKQVPSGENAHAWIECYDKNRFRMYIRIEVEERIGLV